MPTEATISTFIGTADGERTEMATVPITAEMSRVSRFAARALGVAEAFVVRFDGPACEVIGSSLKETSSQISGAEFLREILSSHEDSKGDVLRITSAASSHDAEDIHALSAVVRTPEGRIGASLVAVAPTDREWTDEDEEVIRDAAGLTVQLFIQERLRSDGDWLEDALQIQAAYLDHLFDEAPEAITLLSSDRKIIRVNRAYTELYGYTPEEAVGNSPEHLTVPKTETKTARELGVQAMAGEQVSARVKRCRKDGTEFEVSLLCIPVHISREQVGLYVISRDISGELEAQRAALRNEERFRALIENATDLVAILGSGGVIEYITPSVERLLGRTAPELLGSNGFALIHPDDAPEVISRFSSVVRDNCDGLVEFRMLSLNEGWRTFEVRASSMLNDPEVAGIVINARDITDERQATAMQRRLDAFLAATPDFVAILDPHGRALSINRAFRDLLGLDSDQKVEELTLNDLFPPAVTERLLHEGIPTANRAGTWAGETTVKNEEGDEIPISQVILAHRGTNGNVEFVSTLARDITAQKEAEKALRRSEAHFRSLIDNASDIISIVDEEGRITYVSPSVRRALGYEPAELLGKSLFSLIHPDEIADVGQRFTLVAQGEVPPPGEFRVGRKDGTYRLLETFSQNLLENPAVGGIVFNSRDVTDRRQAEEALIESEQQLIQAQKMEAIGRLAGGIAHDFNNLLTAIKGFTELLLLDFEEKDPRRGFAAEIQGAATRAAGLTRQLLAFSRRQVLQPEVLDLNRSVNEMEKMLQRLIGEDLQMHCKLQADLGRVKADPGQVEQVLMNLVVNARDAMPNGGELNIRTNNANLTEEDVELHPYLHSGPYVLLEVSDTGLGMSKEVQDHIFEPFFTTKEQGKGTGLGLSTVYGIIKQSGGYILVDSNEGHGTTFRIYLPRVEEPVRRRAPERGGTVDLSGTESVLLVEDEVAVRTLVRRVLERSGYKVVEASDGTKALALIEAGGLKPDLLLTDVIMPGMSGRELADELEGRLENLKVLYMSGYTDEAIVHHGVLDAGVAFIEKPFTPEILLQKVREIFDISVETDP